MDSFCQVGKHHCLKDIQAVIILKVRETSMTGTGSGCWDGIWRGYRLPLALQRLILVQVVHSGKSGHSYRH